MATEQKCTSDELQEILVSIEQTLQVEHQALRSLNVAEIDKASDRKERLTAKLQSLVPRIIPTAEVRDAVARVRAAAQANQILLLHARSCVKGAMSLLTGNPADAASYAPRRASSPPSPVRLNVRG